MAERSPVFDPAEFDALDFGVPSPARPALNLAGEPHVEPGADYHVLLDAIRQAGAEGVSAQTAALVHLIEKDAARREQWMRDVRTGLEGVRTASADLERSALRLNLMMAMRIILAGFALLLAVMLYQWLREPKIIERPYGCASGWNAKKATCKGGWVPLTFDAPSPPTT